MQLHKPTPANIGAEEQILGCILTRKTAIDTAVKHLSKKSFYDTKNQAIWQAYTEMYANFDPITSTTVANHMRTAGTLDAVGGMMRLIGMSNKTYSIIEFESNLKSVKELAVRRAVIFASEQALRSSYDESHDIDLLLSSLTSEIEGAQLCLIEAEGATSPESAAAQLIKELEHKREHDGGGIKFGLGAFDEIIGGLNPADLMILAARPGMGKTSMALNNIAVHVAQNYGPVGFISLEMGTSQLWSRVIGSQELLPTFKFRNPKEFSDSEMERIYTWPEKGIPQIWVDDHSQDLESIKTVARNLKRTQKIELLVVDYLQLMEIKGKTGNRESEVSAITRGLKLLAKEMKIPIIALAQLSRAVEQRGGDKRPMLSDLRESGAIEQDADQVVFLYRPEYYDITEDEDGNNLKGVAYAIVAKNRHGEVRDAQLRWTGSTMLFSNYSAVDFSSNAFKPDSNPFSTPGFSDPDKFTQSRVNTEDEEIQF